MSAKTKPLNLLGCKFLWDRIWEDHTQESTLGNLVANVFWRPARGDHGACALRPKSALWTLLTSWFKQLTVMSYFTDAVPGGRTNRALAAQENLDLRHTGPGALGNLNTETESDPCLYPWKRKPLTPSWKPSSAYYHKSARSAYTLAGVNRNSL